MPRRKRQRRSSGEVSYGEALAQMREHTSRSVSDAILDTECIFPPQRSGARYSYQHMQSLFDGILDVLADRIVEECHLGEASLMADSVADRLKVLVEMKDCEGRA